MADAAATLVKGAIPRYLQVAGELREAIMSGKYANGAQFPPSRRYGLGNGLNISSTRVLAYVSGLEVIASGGVHTIEDVLAARDAHLAGVIIGRALYEGTIDLERALQV